MCAELVLADNGAEANGKFLLRDGKVDNAYVLTVIFKGAASHHTLAQDPDTKHFTLNKKPMDTDCASLDEVVEHLREKHKPYWPLRLKDGVEPAGDGGGSKKEKKEKKEKKKKASKGTGKSKRGKERPEVAKDAGGGEFEGVTCHHKELSKKGAERECVRARMCVG